jgi:O-antigen ligase
MIVLLPLAMYLYRTSRSRLSRWIVAGMGVMALMGVVLTMSRGALVAIGILAALVSLFGWIKPSRLTASVIGGLILVPLIAPFYLERMSSIASVTALRSANDVSAADGAIRGRATEMLAALHVFLDHPVLGVGPGQFGPFYVREYSENPDIQFRTLTAQRRAHSLYLELAAENGALGLTVFMAIAVTLLVRLWQARKALLDRAPHLADLATACWLSLVMYLCTGAFLHLSYQRYYWLLVAIAAAALYVIPSPTSIRTARSSSFSRL